MWGWFSFLPPTCLLTWFPVWREDRPLLVSHLSENIWLSRSAVSQLLGSRNISVQIRVLSYVGRCQRSTSPTILFTHFSFPRSCLLLGPCSGAVQRLWGIAQSYSSSQQWKSYNLLYLYLNVQFTGLFPARQVSQTRTRIIRDSCFK